jgi:hypothetical protein
VNTDTRQATASSPNELDYVRGMHCGRSEHERWKQGDRYITAWLGPYKPDMALTEVHASFEHEKLTQAFRDGYESGWHAGNPT